MTHQQFRLKYFAGYSAKKGLHLARIRIKLVKVTDLELGFKEWVRYGLVENGKSRFREQN